MPKELNSHLYWFCYCGLTRIMPDRDSGKEDGSLYCPCGEKLHSQDTTWI